MGFLFVFLIVRLSQLPAHVMIAQKTIALAGKKKHRWFCKVEIKWNLFNNFGKKDF